MNNLLSMHDIIKKTTLSRDKIIKLYRAGEFPKPFKITDKRLVWDESAVDEWINKKRELNSD